MKNKNLFSNHLSSLIFAFIVILISFNSYSQDTLVKQKDKILPKISLGTSISHTGIPIIICGELEYKKITLSVGPKLSLLETFLAKNDPFGLTAGLKYVFLNQIDVKRWNFQILFDYQVAGYKSFSNYGKPADRGSFIHEYIISYGIIYKLSKRDFLCNQLGLGTYHEDLYNVDLNQHFKYNGYNTLVKLLYTHTFSK